MPAYAHSTAGRIKVPLDKKVLSVDDTAYFIESYVHRELYKDRFEKSDKRFYVREFKSVDQDGGKAVIHFITLDNKEKSFFDDQMAIARQTSGVWTYTPEGGGQPIEIYTYVQKWGYYYKKIILPVSATGLLLGCGTFFFIRARRMKKNQDE